MNRFSLIIKITHSHFGHRRLSTSKHLADDEDAEDDSNDYDDREDEDEDDERTGGGGEAVNLVPQQFNRDAYEYGGDDQFISLGEDLVLDGDDKSQGASNSGCGGAMMLGMTSGKSRSVADEENQAAAAIMATTTTTSQQLLDGMYDDAGGGGGSNQFDCISMSGLDELVLNEDELAVQSILDY